MDRNGVIYSIKCKVCQTEYIGETGKELRKNAVRRRDPPPALFQHSKSTSHEIDWEGSAVLGQQSSNHTQNNPNAIKRSITVPVPYMPLIDRLTKKKKNRNNR